MKKVAIILGVIVIAITLILGVARTREFERAIDALVTITVVTNDGPVVGADVYFSDVAIGRRDRKTDFVGATDSEGTVQSRRMLSANEKRSNHLFWTHRRIRVYLNAARVRVEKDAETIASCSLDGIPIPEFTNPETPIQVNLQVNVESKVVTLTSPP